MRHAIQMAMSDTAACSLPQPDSAVEVRLLDGGSFMAEMDKLHAGAGKDRFRMYNWAFHIFSPKKNRHVLWDLGMTGVLLS